jgi:hypothetical protein
MTPLFFYGGVSRNEKTPYIIMASEKKGGFLWIGNE